MGAAIIRFEVLVNGQRLCLAGQDGYGCLEVRVQSTRIAAESLPWPFSPDPPVEHLHLSVGGYDEAIGDVRWNQVTLGAGDEVTVRVLGAGACDPPTEVNPPLGPDDVPF